MSAQQVVYQCLKMSTAVNRADLVRFLIQNPQCKLTDYCEFFGFTGLSDVNKPLKTKDPKMERQDGNKVTTTLQDNVQFSPVFKFPKPCFYRITAYEQISVEDNKTDLISGLLKLPEPQDDDQDYSLRCKVQKQKPLVPWSKVWPFLRYVLGEYRDSRHLDINKTIKTLSNGQVLDKVDYEQYNDWADDGQLIIDYAFRTKVFRHDMNSLRDQLLKWRGCNGFEVLLMDERTGMRCFNFNDKRCRLFSYRPPEHPVPVVILSDLGLYGTSEVRLDWYDLGRCFQQRGIKPVVLVPATALHKLAWLKPYYHLIRWDRGQPMRLNQPRPASTSAVDSENTKTLLSLLSPFGHIDFALLRAARFLFPGLQMSANNEVAAFLHEDVYSEYDGFGFNSSEEKMTEYYDAFRLLPCRIIAALPKLLDDYHARLTRIARYREWLDFSLLSDGLVELDSVVNDKIRDAKQFYKALAGMLYRQQDDDEVSHINQFGKYLGEYPKPDGQQFELFNAIFAVSNKDLIKSNKMNRFPIGLTAEDLRRYIGNKKNVNQTYTIRQKDERLILSPVDERADDAPKGRVMVKFCTDTEILNQQWGVGDKRFHYGLFLDGKNTVPVHLKKNEKLILSTRSESFTIESFEKPDWASQVGVDRYGLYADLKVESVVQKMRWINPGKFMMGSPESEAERLWVRDELENHLKERNLTKTEKVKKKILTESEVLHEVVLTEGYWLADTACTQFFWEAITAGNPSKFKNSKRPVEMVSWEDVDEFLQILNKKFGNVSFRLPTEAEWEYACRAGTTTPFAFGENITTEQVNFCGDYPYNKGVKGEYRKETVEVKSLPVNPWGLYEMHGNVWEWCSDWFQFEYEKDSKINPQGPKSGEYRVVRGGSWYSFGRYVRSAYRYWFEPGYRDFFTGFRLALGHSSSGRGSAVTGNGAGKQRSIG